MNYGDFKRIWSSVMDHSIPKQDLYLRALREAGLAKPAAGRGLSSENITFDDALNLGVALLAAPSPSHVPELVTAIRNAAVRRNTVRRKLTSKEELVRYGAKSDSFPATLRMLAEKLPNPGNVGTDKEREVDVFSIDDFQTHYPLHLIFHPGRAQVELVMQRNGKGLAGLELPEAIDLEWLNSKVGRTPVTGRDSIERCDWLFLHILRGFLSGGSQ